MSASLLSAFDDRSGVGRKPLQIALSPSRELGVGVEVKEENMEKVAWTSRR